VADVTLNGHAATAATLSVPGVGLWYAGVDLATDVELSGAVTLTVLDTTWSGFIVSGGTVDGRARYRVIAGAGGWGAELPPKAYANDAGLTVAKLLNDVASEAGETIASPPTTRLGVHFNRPALPASFLLNLLAPRDWYARADGVVAFGARPALPASPLPVVERNPAARSVTVALTDTAVGLLPGIATEYGTAADVEYELGPEGLRVRLYASLQGSRRVEAYRRLLAALDPGARFRGVHEYRVVTQSGERLNLQPVRSRAELPDLARVPVRQGVPGVKATHLPGSHVLVAFLDNGDLSRPAVVGFDAPDQPGWMPLFLELGDAPTLGVARQTDPIVAGPFAGTITGPCSLRIKAGL
jgi:hypothetical protein